MKKLSPIETARYFLLASVCLSAVACTLPSKEYELCDDINVKCPEETANIIVE